jgi:small subunit ribosomal protein S20
VANTKQAAKRARQSKDRHLLNSSQKSRMRTAIKKVLVLIHTKQIEAAQSEFRSTVSLIDKLAGRKRIHANKAARLKSRLNAKLRTAALAIAA